MPKTDKVLFASKIGAVLAAAGSAVGLGNIWRFPTEAGTHGGAAFILIYILFMLILGVPVMVTEFAIGRHCNKSVTKSFLEMSHGRRGWHWMGLFPVVAGIVLLGYYSVVAGWTLYYALDAGMNGLAGKSAADFAADFGAFVSDPFKPLIAMTLVLIATCGIVARGVQKGIERCSMVMMPLLFIVILVLVGCSLTLPGAGAGLRFLFTPDFSKVTGETLLGAMGQAFFSLSVGICCLCTYACYFRKDVDLIKDGLQVASIDTLVALCSGLIIFPAVFSIEGIEPNAGPSLVFITLPNVFQTVFNASPVLTYVFSLLFYILLLLASLTSSISMLEMAAAYFDQELGIERKKAARLCTLACFVLGVASSLSFGVWSDVSIFGMTIFDFLDFFIAKFCMPLGSLAVCIFAGYVVREDVLRSEVTNGGKVKNTLYRIYRFIIRYVAPILILIIFADGLLG